MIRALDVLIHRVEDRINKNILALGNGILEDLAARIHSIYFFCVTLVGSIVWR
jgi:hypothetical protein